ncbi:hypothetical protein GCM10010261_62830 [Streptomyces pilosus]|nr:hypothetical protein GCM10010261_62830 [Streptomyces pilosus]
MSGASRLDAVTHHLEHFAAPGRDGHVFVGPQGGQLRRSNFRGDWFITSDRDRAIADRLGVMIRDGEGGASG